MDRDLIEMLDNTIRNLQHVRQRLADAKPVPVADPRPPLPDKSSKAWWFRGAQFLHWLAKEGTCGFDANRQVELALRAGYLSGKDTNGYYNGADACLRRDPATNRRYLTKSGDDELKRADAEFGSKLDTGRYEDFL